MKETNRGLIFVGVYILLIILMASFTASELPQQIKPGDCVNIKIPLNASWVNISTLTYPNQSMLNLNWKTTLYGGTFYNNSFCNTNQLGIYTYEFFDSTGFSSGNSFTVTNNGDGFDTSQAIVYIIILSINLIFLTLFVYLSFKLPYENEKSMRKNGEVVITKVIKAKYIKLMSIWFSYGLFLWLITILTGLINNYVSFEPLKDLTTNIYILLTVGGYLMSIFMVWFIFLNIWKDIILNKTILKEGYAIINGLN